jgi:hypothetical protein
MDKMMLYQDLDGFEFKQSFGNIEFYLHSIDYKGLYYFIKEI